MPGSQRYYLYYIIISVYSFDWSTEPVIASWMAWASQGMSRQVLALKIEFEIING